MKIFSCAMIVMATFCFAALATADDNSYLKSRMWERQEQGIEGVLTCFKNDCPASDYKEYLLQIVSAETNLIVYGVSPKNTRLVSRLASDIRSVSDFPVFAYRVFKKRLGEFTGFSPKPENVFKGETFRIFANNNSYQHITVDFK